MENNGSIIHIRWEPPPIDTLKFNVDGTHSKINGFSLVADCIETCGVVLFRVFIATLAAIIPWVLRCEMWSLVHANDAICIASNIQLDRVISKINCTLITVVVLNGSTIISNLKPLI
jgi:hypothetical protein